jgi:hypothetical protein
MNIMKIKITFFLMMIFAFSANIFSQSWQNLNAPIGITMADINKNNSTIFGTANGFGIHRSVDGGSNWTTATSEPAPTGLYLYQHFTCTNSGALLVGLMDFSNTYGTVFPLLRSTDNGDNWTYIAPFSYSTSRFYNAPNNNIYAVASGSYGKYLLRSTDDGLTFTTQADSVLDIAVAANNDIYALMINGVSSNKLAKSTDGGNTWSNLAATGIPAQPIRIIICPNGTIFITDGSNSNQAMRSTDGGNSFSGVGDIFPGLWNDFNNNVFAYKASGTFRSTDNGLTWQNITSGLVNNLLANVMAHPNGTVYAYGSGNIYKLTGTTRINEVSSTNSGIEVFPNPSNGKFQVKSQQLPIYSVEIFNAMGVLVMQTRDSGDVDLTGSPKGIYVVKIYTGTTICNTKIFIQ